MSLNSHTIRCNMQLLVIKKILKLILPVVLIKSICIAVMAEVMVSTQVSEKLISIHVTLVTEIA